MHLPPYSPQLNPDEQVWKNVKESVAKIGHIDKYCLRGKVRNALGPVDNQQIQMKAAESATNEENRSESLS